MELKYYETCNSQYHRRTRWNTTLLKEQHSMTSGQRMALMWPWVKRSISDFLAMEFIGVTRTTKLFSVTYRTATGRKPYQHSVSDLYFGVTCKLRINLFTYRLNFEF